MAALDREGVAAKQAKLFADDQPEQEPICMADFGNRMDTRLQRTPNAAAREEAWAALKAGYGFDAQALATRMKPASQKPHSLDGERKLKLPEKLID